MEIVQRIENCVLGTEREQFIKKIISPEVRNLIVLDAFMAVDRKHFAPQDEKELAYLDKIIPLNEESATISQPSLVAKMIDFLNPTEKSETVLQIGTGSGYDSAILAHCYRKVYTVEHDPELAITAANKLQELGYTNIEFKTGDGAIGWSEEMLFDAIIVTASTKRIPDQLVRQLKPGGKIVIPLGENSPHESRLILGEKCNDGTLVCRSVSEVGFVPLISNIEGCWTKEEMIKVEEQEKIAYQQGILEAISEIATTFYHITAEDLVAASREKFGYDLSDEELLKKIIYKFLNPNRI